MNITWRSWRLVSGATIALVTAAQGCAHVNPVTSGSRALSCAEAGLDEVIARMSDTADTSAYLGQPLFAWETSPGWGRYLVPAFGLSAEDPEAAATEVDSLDNDGDGLVDEPGERYPEVLSLDGGAALYRWAKVSYVTTASGRALLFGDGDRDFITPAGPNLDDGLPMLSITARGEAGGTARTVTAEAVRPPLPIPATAMYTEMDSVKFNGTKFVVCGHDWDPDTGMTRAMDSVHAILTTGSTGRIGSALRVHQVNNVYGKGPEPSVAVSPVDLDLDALAASWLDAFGPVAQSTVTPPSPGRLTYVYGDYAPADGTTGSGILIVDGRLTVSAQFTWTGVILVRGPATIVGSGSGTHIYGTVLVSDGGEPVVVGGNADVLYSSIALRRVAAMFPYEVLNRCEY